MTQPLDRPASHILGDNLKVSVGYTRRDDGTYDVHMNTEYSNETYVFHMEEPPTEEETLKLGVRAFGVFYHGAPVPADWKEE